MYLEITKNETVPLSGQATHSTKALGVIRFHKTDNNAVDRSTALGGENANEGFWEELDDSIIAEDEESTFIDEGAASLGEPRLFYRVRLISLPE